MGAAFARLSLPSAAAERCFPGADRPEHGADGRLPVGSIELAFADCGEHLQHDADHRLHCEIH